MCSVHINFEDTGLIIDNLQLFLKKTIDPTLHLSGVWDIPSHEALIEYLRQPNTETVYSIKAKILNNFLYRNSAPPYSFLEGGGIANFNNEVTPTSVLYYTKPTATSYDNGVLFISKHLEELDKFIQQYGWRVSRHTGYGSGSTDSGRLRAEILIEKHGIKNHFPHKEVLPMVNLATNKYIYGFKFADENNASLSHITRDSKYKIALIPCVAGDTFTIAHAYSMSCEMAFAYTSHTVRELKSGAEVLHVYSRMAESLRGPVDPGNWDYYEIPEGSETGYLLVQLPYTEGLTSYQQETIRIQLGDVNQDGNVDMSDVNMLDQWVTAIENNSPPPFELSGNAKVAANVARDVDIEGNPIVDRTDVEILRKAVSEDNWKALGYVEYSSRVRVSAYAHDKLLVMYGELAQDEDYNVPVDQFCIEPWSIHSKFLEYFLGRVIHKYSNTEDICWLQKNFSKVDGRYGCNNLGNYDEPESYETSEKLVYDSARGCYFYYEHGMKSEYKVLSSDNLETAVFLDKHGLESSIHIQHRRLYKGNVYMNKIALRDGTIVTDNAEESLKVLMQAFQLETNKKLKAQGIAAANRLKWTFGNYCVDTDKYMLQNLSSRVTHKVGAFR